MSVFIIILRKTDIQKAKVLCFLICLFLIHSCTNTSVKEVFVLANDFPNTIELVDGEELNFHQLMPSSIDVIDSLVVVSDYKGSPRLNIYNRNGDFKVGFGFIGRGPNEYLAPEWNGQSFFKGDDSNKFIYIYEFGYGLIHKLNLSAILRKEHNSNSKIKKYYLPPEVMNTDNVFFVNDTLYGEATSNSDVKYFKHKLGSKTFMALGQFNNHDIIQGAKSIEKRVNLDRSFLGYSLHNSKFVSAYLRFNKVVIMDSNMNEELLIYYGNEKKHPTSDDIGSRNNIFYFRKPFAGKKHIYVPYVGVKNLDRTYSKELHVYDYNGNPIKRYLFDEIFTSFTVDEEKQKLYLITNSEDNQFLSYDL